MKRRERRISEDVEHTQAKGKRIRKRPARVKEHVELGRDKCVPPARDTAAEASRQTSSEEQERSSVERTKNSAYDELGAREADHGHDGLRETR